MIEKKKKRTIIISSIVIVAIIFIVLVGVRLVVLNSMNISEFGCLANSDPESHQSYNTRAILDIDKSHDLDHTTYIVVIDNLKVKIIDDTDVIERISIRITKNGLTSELEQWYLRDDDLRIRMSDEEDGYYTHFDFSEFFDVNAEMGSYYVLQIGIFDSVNAMVSLHKYFAYEEIEETPTPTPTPTPTETTPTETTPMQIPVVVIAIFILSIISLKKEKLRSEQ